jgi:hypothetical protein
MKILELLLQAFARVLLPRHPVDSGRGIPSQSEQRLSEPVNGDVVKKRSELCLPVLPCYLPYTVQRIRHVMIPALSPGRVLLVRVPLGQAPSLHDLRPRFPGFVRLLRRYYRPVRLPRVVHLRITALAFPQRPVSPSETGDPGISRFSRMEVLHMHRVFDCAGSVWSLR